MQIIPLAPTHAADAARLHILGQPGTFLTTLGPGVLTALYRTLPRTRAGFGFAAIDHEANGVDEAGALLGFISATTGVDKLFAEIGTTGLGTLLPPLVGQLARHPALIWRSVQTVAYPLLVGGDENGPPPAELLSIMVEPNLRSQGTGTRLLAALVAACQERAILLLDVTVDASNEGAQRFYVRHGFVHHHDFTLYARRMAQYRLAIPSG
ncbi:MAG: GNAT family N-acetyltransferase [Caldilineaceae bacterium]|nr:GNAT family N-acetyltransferase [Caldilineaceae bacterium]